MILAYIFSIDIRPLMIHYPSYKKNPFYCPTDFLME
jgi:hypothetical protein